MKKFFFVLALGLIVVLNMGGINKNTEIVSFESYRQKRGVFEKLTHFPLILRIIDKIYPFPNSGKWKISPQASILNILMEVHFNKPINDLRKITFPPGINAQEAMNILNERWDLSGPKIELQEASILPDTYFYKEGANRANILKIASNAMQKKIAEIWAKRSADYPLTKQEWLILASIIEKETPLKDEMPLVAGVFLNRLKKGMRLQSDATVLYGIKKGSIFNVQKDKVFNRDLWMMHDYNTYRKKGLPPGPICLPGLDAIKAALKPKNSPYYYFIWCGRKSEFSTNFEEHKRYKKICLN